MTVSAVACVLACARPRMPVPSARRPRRGPLEALGWFWRTRIRSLWTVVLPARRRRAVDAQRAPLAFQRRAEPTFALGHGQARTQPDPNGITAILTVYTRGDYLEDQIRALRAQTVPPVEIWVWCNDAGQDIVDRSALADRVVVSNANFSFWGRFALAQLARTPYVAIYDDDVLPEPRWHENCLATWASGVEGVLGGSGVVLPVEGGYSSRHKVGWNGHHYEQAVEVDLVGHAWLMPKALIAALWREEPPTWQNGEDIHLGWMVRKHFGVGVFVPPHPASDPSLWSCRPEFGKRVSRSGAATHAGSEHRSDRSAIVDAHRADGWRVVAERGPAE